MNLTQNQTKNLSELFIKIGQQQGQLIEMGRKVAHQSQTHWNQFVASLLKGEGNPNIETAYQDLAIAVKQYIKKHQSKVTFAVVYDYFVAKIIRSIQLEPAKFPHQWYLACTTSEIPELGDFITLKLFQEPIVIVHQEDGEIKAFLNVCTHRQSPVFEGKGCIGSQKQVLCPYHGWAFGIDGHCQNAPGANRGEFGDNLDLNLYNLQEINLKQEGKLIFIQLGSILSESPELKPDDEAESISIKIAQLLDQVSPGYAEGQTAFLPETIRLWLKIGRLETQLTDLYLSLENLKQMTSQKTEQFSETERVIDTLLRELKQAILTVEQEDFSLSLRDILEGIELHQEQGQLTPFNSHENEANDQSESVNESTQLNTQPLPIWIYGDSALFSLETEQLIAPTWQFVCHVSEVSEARNYTWLDIIGERAYVIRTDEGTLFAGKLKHLDDRHFCPNFNLPNYGLDPIDIDVFYGFIFIRLKKGGSQLKDLWYQADLLTPYNLETMKPINGIGRYDINVEVDYKLLWENFLEDYHFPMMHKGLTRRFKLSSDCEGINGMIIPMKDPPSVHLTPIELTYYQAAKTLANHSWQYENQLQQTAAKTQSLSERLCYSAFCSMSSQEEMPMPFSLSVFPEHVQTFSIVPGGARESRFHIRSYAHEIDVNSPEYQTLKAAQLANIQLLIESLHEDIRVNYITQDSVSSRLFHKKGIFSMAELDVAKFQQSIRLKLPITQSKNRPFSS